MNWDMRPPTPLARRTDAEATARWYDDAAIADVFTDPTPRCVHCNRPVRIDQYECYDCQYGNLGNILMDELLAELDERDTTPVEYDPAAAEESAELMARREPFEAEE